MARRFNTPGQLASAARGLGTWTLLGAGSVVGNAAARVAIVDRRGRATAAAERSLGASLSASSTVLGGQIHGLADCGRSHSADLRRYCPGECRRGHTASVRSRAERNSRPVRDRLRGDRHRRKRLDHFCRPRRRYITTAERRHPIDVFVYGPAGHPLRGRQRIVCLHQCPERDRAGTVTCSISIDGEVVSTNTSSGAYTIATCEGAVP